jgi:hypothetical protein
MLVQTLLFSAQVMDKDVCFTMKDKLYAIDAYSHYVENNDSYYVWVDSIENCLFNYNQSYWNTSNISFQPTYDRRTLLLWAATNGSIIND